MNLTFRFFLFCSTFFFVQTALTQPLANSLHEMIFVSDTQEPMKVEKIRLKANQNQLATSRIFTEILQRKPANVYMLGDVVSLGFNNKKWGNIDLFLDSCNKEGIVVNALLGNHDVMGRDKKGERNFNKRFPQNIRTGYVSVADSVAVILLNSNFSTLSKTAFAKQQNWYKETLRELDKTDSILVVIVACHHAPYTNSRIVGSSVRVQNNFVPAFIKSNKAQLFVTGHAHAFEHFLKQDKDFLVIGGGGGLHQPLDSSSKRINDLAWDYKPMFHYLSLHRLGNTLEVTSHALNKDFNGFETGHSFITRSKKPAIPPALKDSVCQ
jgi:Icc-related predicted phosphoesterase